MLILNKSDPKAKFPNAGIDWGLREVLFFVTAGVSALCQFAVIFWGFALIWQTFLFKFGLLGRLFFREFPILFLVLLHFLLFCGEIAFRIVDYVTPNKHGDPVTIMTDWKFIILLYVRRVIGVFAYAGCIKSAIEVMHPSYYKPYRWFVI